MYAEKTLYDTDCWKTIREAVIQYAFSEDIIEEHLHKELDQMFLKFVDFHFKSKRSNK